MKKKFNSKEEAKRVILKIIAIAGGKLRKKVALYKAFYYAHLWYWKEYTGILTDYPIVKMPHGPGIDRGTDLLSELEKDGLIKINKETGGFYDEQSFLLTSTHLIDRNDKDYQAIKKAVDYVIKKNAIKLSETTHENSISWQESEIGDELNIYLDLLEDEEYLDLKNRLNETNELVKSVFEQS